MDSATLHKRLSTYSGTTPRYMDFEKTGGKPLMMGDGTNGFPTPYATLPMGTSTDAVSHVPFPKFFSNNEPVIQKQLDPRLSHVSIKKDAMHIYDYPQ